MQWDLGAQGLAVLGMISLGFGAFAVLVGGHGSRRRVTASAITTLACFATGLLTSEVFFGWATEEELQPNVDGLSRDEVLLSSVITTVIVVVGLRYLAHRTSASPQDSQWHAVHRTNGRHARKA